MLRTDGWVTVRLKDGTTAKIASRISGGRHIVVVQPLADQEDDDAAITS